MNAQSIKREEEKFSHQLVSVQSFTHMTLNNDSLSACGATKATPDLEGGGGDNKKRKKHNVMNRGAYLSTGLFIIELKFAVVVVV